MVADEDGVAAVPSSVVPAPRGDSALGVPNPEPDNVFADSVGAPVEDVAGVVD